MSWLVQMLKKNLSIVQTFLSKDDVILKPAYKALIGRLFDTDTRSIWNTERVRAEGSDPWRLIQVHEALIKSFISHY